MSGRAAAALVPGALVARLPRKSVLPGQSRVFSRELDFSRRFLRFVRTRCPFFGLSAGYYSVILHFEFNLGKIENVQLSRVYFEKRTHACALAENE